MNPDNDPQHDEAVEFGSPKDSSYRAKPSSRVRTRQPASPRQPATAKGKRPPPPRQAAAAPRSPVREPAVPRSLSPRQAAAPPKDVTPKKPSTTREPPARERPIIKGRAKLTDVDQDLPAHFEEDYLPGRKLPPGKTATAPMRPPRVAVDREAGTEVPVPVVVGETRQPGAKYDQTKRMTLEEATARHSYESESMAVIRGNYIRILSNLPGPYAGLKVQKKQVLSECFVNQLQYGVTYDAPHEKDLAILDALIQIELTDGYQPPEDPKLDNLVVEALEKYQLV